MTLSAQRTSVRSRLTPTCVQAPIGYKPAGPTSDQADLAAVRCDRCEGSRWGHPRADCLERKLKAEKPQAANRSQPRRQPRRASGALEQFAPGERTLLRWCAGSRQSPRSLPPGPFPPACYRSEPERPPLHRRTRLFAWNHAPGPDATRVQHSVADADCCSIEQASRAVRRSPDARLRVRPISSVRLRGGHDRFHAPATSRRAIALATFQSPRTKLSSSAVEALTPECRSRTAYAAE